MREQRSTTGHEVALPQATIRYREAGTGAPILLVHGLLTNGDLWREVMPLLAREFRVIAPDWPLGSQELALPEGTDVSPPALAQIVTDFMAALDLQAVTLVGNDTGGAICQLVAVEHPQRLARLVLTPCDAYEHFPPPAFKPLQLLGANALGVGLIAQSMRSARARGLPIAYGWLMRRPHPELTRAWVQPLLRSAAIRTQVAAILRGFDRRHTLGAAARFGEFSKPVLIAWAPEDRFFKLADAQRLARDFPDARLEQIEDSYTFVMLDQPARTAGLIASFAREPMPTLTAP